MTDERPTSDTLATDADRAVTRDTDAVGPLFSDDRATVLRERWHELQARFVDDPRETVAEADGLVQELLDELQQTFTDARGSLERQWSEGDDVSTDELRIALQRYRSFFERLLAV